MPAFDELTPASYAGIGFAVTRWEVRGSGRVHLHQYPHSPGGQNEKLGRDPYEIEFDAVFSTNDPAHPGAFPDNLNVVRVLLEQQEAGPVVVPHLGTIPCVPIDWVETGDPARMRDGVRMRLRFREDSEEAVSLESLVSTTYSSLDGAIELVVSEIEPLEEPEPDLFEAVEGLLNEVQGVMDQVELMGDLASAKIEGLTSKIQQIDASFDALTEPENHGLVGALHDLGAALIKTRDDVRRSSRPTTSYTVPVEMSIAQVSTAIYGTTARASEILLMNAVTDAFAIPEGTTLRVYND